MSMSPAVQPLHIVKKDALHLWPETLVTVALLIAFAWAESASWEPIEGFNPAALAVGFLKFLLPVSWLVLTSRLVHDEELVGDRQFWTTRPYTWYSLLLAKVLYLAVFILLPVLMMQTWLLHHAGLYPTLVVPTLVKNLLFLAMVFLLPLLAIAAATATFVRFISSVLGGVIYLFAVLIFASYKWSDTLDTPGEGYALGAALVAILIAALLVQYARRKTLIARLLLASLPLVIILFALLTPTNLIANHRFPDKALATATFDSNPNFQQPDGRVFLFKNKITLTLPLEVQYSGLASGDHLEVEAVNVALDGPKGVHYVSGWAGVGGRPLPEHEAETNYIRLPETIFDQVKGQPVALHLQFAVQVIQSGTPYTINATEKAFPIPGHGACTVSAVDNVLDCRFPFGNDQQQQITAQVHDGTCLTPGDHAIPAFGFLQRSPMPFGISSVDLEKVSFEFRGHPVPLCPDSSLTLTPAVPGAYGRIHVDIPAITLDPYAMRIGVRPAKLTQPQPQQ